MSIEHTRESLVARAKYLKSEIEQIFLDAEHWNNAVRKPHEELIDPDPQGELKQLLNGLNVMLAGGSAAGDGHK